MRTRVIKNGLAGGRRPPGQDDGVWVEEKLPGGWLARGRMVARHGRVVVAELRITPLVDPIPSGGVTRDVVRSVPLGSMAPHVLALASFHQGSGIGGLDEHFASTVGALLPSLTRIVPPRPRPRRAAGRGDRFYAELARDYLAALERGSSRPVTELAAARKESVSRVRDMVHTARELSLLSPGEPGRRGGRLLPRAHALLKDRPQRRPR
jgi:hypothetical protein